MVAVFGAAAQIALGLDRCPHFCGKAVCQQLRRLGRVGRQVKPHCLARPGTDGEAIALGRFGGGAGQHREIGLAVPHRLVTERSRFLRHDHPHEEIPVVGAGGVLGQRHDAALVQLYRGVQCQEQGQHIREPEAAINAAAHGGKVAQLHTHDMPHGLPHGSVRVCGQPSVQLQLPQGDHGPDGELLLRLLDGIQP